MELFLLFSFIYWDPKPEVFVVPILNWPILWYGVCFASGFAIGFLIFYALLLRMFQMVGGASAALKKKAMFLTDRITIYMIIATILGARLGHFLFYENPSEYLSHPIELFLIRKGGLASHGAAIGIVLAIILFTRRYKKELGRIGMMGLLDLISVPAAFVGACIRFGNFVNQEILGTKTSVPWAVIFGHPMDHSLPVPRHPVQLYEAVFYFFVFGVLWGLSYFPKYFLSAGRLFGVFLTLVFGGRFVLEFLKIEQSALLEKSFLTMGQLLSILPILARLYFWLRKQKR